MTTSVTADQSKDVVAHFFRHEYAKAVAYLTRNFGPSHIELIEDAIQDAMVKAMRSWGYNQIPENPTAWIFRVAHNRLIDVLKRAAKSSVLEDETSTRTAQLPDSTDDHIVMEEELEDDQLKLIFSCCDPVLSEKSQVILTLKLMCGFSIQEIAHSLLLSDDATAKAFTRAKDKLKKSDFHLLSPSPGLVKKRLDVVLKIIYLLFNEGYKSAAGSALIRQDLGFEAIRLTHFLLRNQHYNLPRVNALMALMLLQSSRFAARVSEKGELIPLQDQDRGLWDYSLIQDGIFYLVEATKGNHMTEYHVQASIAAFHCTSTNYGTTDWKSILKLYDYQSKAYPNPITSLNRCVALAEVHGAEHALKELERLNKDEKLEKYYLFHAIRGKLHANTGNVETAKKAWEMAMTITENEIEKNYLFGQLKRIEKGLHKDKGG